MARHAERILLVDDEPQLLRALSTNLRTRGYEVIAAARGEDALRSAAETPPDLIVLDLGLPGIDGIQVLRHLRTWTTVPVIVLSVRNEESDKVAALDAGADDYVTKPFGMDELLARVRVALRRVAHPEEEPTVTAGDVRIDLADRRAYVAGRPVQLSPTEWHVVAVLARNHDKLVTQSELLREVWGPTHEVHTNYLRVYLARIRAKFERDPSQPRYFVTEPGVGYRFLTREPSPST